MSVVVFDNSPMVSYTDFTPEVILALGDPPVEIVENYVREACIALCERSQVVIRRVAVDFFACATEYLIEPPTCERIVSIQRVCGDAGCNSYTKVSAHEPCGCSCVTSCHGSQVWFVPPKSIQVSPAPSRDIPGAMWVDVAVAPKRDSCEVAQQLYERYHETIIHGTLARMYMLRSTPWFDPKLAVMHSAEFDKGVSVAGLDRLTNGARGPFKNKTRRIL